MGARWSDYNIDRLKQLWNEGRSASEIAMELSRDGMYMSRNMVIGKAHRLGLDARPSPIVRSHGLGGVE